VPPGVTAGAWPGLLGAAAGAAGVPLGVAAGAWPSLPGAATGATTAGPDGAAHGSTAWAVVIGTVIVTVDAGGASTATGLEATGHGGWPEFLAVAVAALVNSRVLQRCQRSAMTQPHIRFDLMRDAWSGVRFRPLFHPGPRQVTVEVATHQGRRQLGMLLLLHQWMLTSPILGMNYCSCSIELLVLITCAMNLFVK
jgi:hypothetical protein